MRIIKIVFLHSLCVIILTVLTQVGGILWLLACLLSVKLKLKKRYVFPIVYILFNVLIIPPIASQLGRERLPYYGADLGPRNMFYPLTFRNYVNPQLDVVLKASANSLAKDSIKITYLDANFPFKDGFPLLPHRSHSDGKKIDISFMYKDSKGKPTSKKPSLSGYGAFVQPTNYTNNICLKKGHWQYDFSKHLTLGVNKTLQFDKRKTRAIIKEFLSHSETEKIFIEPYLKQYLHVNHRKIRFHGCKAVRHDDHIHLQIK